MPTRFVDLERREDGQHSGHMEDRRAKSPALRLRSDNGASFGAPDALSRLPWSCSYAAFADSVPFVDEKPMPAKNAILMVAPRHTNGMFPISMAFQLKMSQ